jgi:hypothetical protein
MSDPTILVLPSSDGSHASALGAFLNGQVTCTVVAIDSLAPGSRAARTCAAINTMDPTPPLTLVAYGDAALLLPAVALAQRR